MPVDVSAATERRTLAVNVALAEFAELRAEIARRSRSQEQFVGLALTGSAAIGSVVVTHPQTRALLLAILLVGPLLGFLYIDHARTIDRLGDYIRTNLATNVRHEIADAPQVADPATERDVGWLLGWETRVSGERKKITIRGFLLSFTLLPFFLGPVAAGFAAKDSKDALSDFEFTLAQTAGLVLAAFYLLNWVAWLYRSAGGSEATPADDSTRDPVGRRTDETGAEPQSPDESTSEPPA
jgi:hypothetical protein